MGQTDGIPGDPHRRHGILRLLPGVVFLVFPGGSGASALDLSAFEPAGYADGAKFYNNGKIYQVGVNAFNSFVDALKKGQLSSAYCIENDCAIEFTDGQFSKVISAGGKAYFVEKEGQEIKKREL